MVIIISYILKNFPLVMLFLSILISCFKKDRFFNRLSNTILFFCVGVSGIWEFIFHIFYLKLAPGDISLQPSLFEYEVAITNLGIGFLGLSAGFLSTGYKKATATFYTVFSLGNAISHFQQTILLYSSHEIHPRSALWMNIIIPIILWIAILASTEKSEPQINWNNNS